MLEYLKNSEVTRDITRNANRILREHYGEPWGTSVPFTSDGKAYIARLERHYHTPGGPLKPWGSHTGVSVLRETGPISDELDNVDAAKLELERETLVTPPPKGTFRLGTQSLARLRGVDDRLVRVFQHAIEITEVDFTVVEGRRSKERQAELVRAGASKTMNSRHLTGHAVDVAPWIGGKISWNWPDFHRLAPFVFQAAKDLDMPIEWGGNWPPPNTADGPHWQIPWGK